ncbi:MAG: hypothetical protein Q4A16_08525 [Lautropia sp.]|nr:hypothetical protein [Lautropia sp.]
MKYDDAAKFMASQDQRGVVMLMTLILLAVMAMGTAMAVKVSMNTDMVAHNLRNRQLAFQAAEMALRHCETMITDNPAGTLMIAGELSSSKVIPRNEWLDESLWKDYKHEVSLNTLGMPNTVRVAPQCMIRHFTIDEWREINPPVAGSVTAESRGFDANHLVFYRITARGFSPDYRAAPALSSGNGWDYQNTRGSEVRLQSMIRSIQ